MIRDPEILNDLLDTISRYVLRSLFGTNNGIGSAAIVFDGTPEQKEKYLPRYASVSLASARTCYQKPEPRYGLAVRRQARESDRTVSSARSKGESCCLRFEHISRAKRCSVDAMCLRRKSIHVPAEDDPGDVLIV
jgi:hypothetical protein